MTEQVPSEDQVRGYMVLEEETGGDLEILVDRYLAEGWELVGGISVAIGSYEGRDGQENYHKYCQAMVKR